MKRTILLFAALLSCSLSSFAAAGWPSGYGGVMLQGFSWDSYADTKWTNLEGMADDLDGSFDLLWIPNAGNCGGGSQMGYAPKYWFPVGDNYTSSFGDLTQLRSMVSAMRNHGIGVIGDVVINHRSNMSNWVDFPAETYKGTTYQLTSTDIVADDDGGATAAWAAANGYSLSHYNDTGDGWSGMRDLDHKSANVQNNVKAYLDMLLSDLGYVGFRYDMVAGYAATYIKTYNNAAQPTYSVGECWKTGSQIKSWIDGTKDNGTPTSAAFDFQFRYSVRDAINNNDWTNLNPSGQELPLISNNLQSGAYKQWAVTFVENHDTQDRGNVSGYTKDPINADTLAANAYMLAMPGTPCVFLPHLLDYKQDIKNMIAARKAAGVTNTSTYTVSSSQQGRFVTSTTGTKTRLICAVGNVGSYAGPGNTVEILSGYHYKYFMPTSANVVWADVPSGTYGQAFDVKLTAVSANYTTVVYTTDGTEPSASNGTRVASGSSIHVDADMTLRAALINGSTIVSGSELSRSYKVQATKTITVYLKDPGWDNVYFFTFNENDGNSLRMGSWPGTKITRTKKVRGQTFYYHTFESTSLDYQFDIIFNNGGSGNNNQTVDITGVSEDVYYEITGGGGSGKLTVTDVTEDYTGPYTVTVYFKNLDWSNVYFYAWDKNGEKLGNWPGQRVTRTATVDGDTYFCQDFVLNSEDDALSILFNDGNGTQTEDVTGIATDVYCVCDHATDSQGHHYVLDKGQKSITVYFMDPSLTVSTWSTVSYYAWNAAGTPLGSWPGKQITDQKVVGGDTYYYHRMVLDENAVINLIFNNAAAGGSSTKQTTDIEGIAQDTYYRLTGQTSGGKYLWEEVVPDEFEPYTATVYFKQPDSGWDEVCFHSWATGTVKNGDGSALNDQWPGQQGSIKYIDGEPWCYRTYLIAAEGAKVNVVINNNNNGKQTVDIIGIDQDVYYTLGAKNNDDKYQVVDAGDMSEVITDIAFDVDELHLEMGASQPLEVTVSGSHICSPVVWTTSDESVVALVEANGLPRRVNGPRRQATSQTMMYGVGEGMATITATIAGQSTSCNVYVDSPTGVSVLGNDMALVRVDGDRIVINSRHDTTAQLISLDGRMVTVQVHAGSNAFNFGGPIVFVKIDGKVHKLRK